MPSQKKVKIVRKSTDYDRTAYKNGFDNSCVASTAQSDDPRKSEEYHENSISMKTRSRKRDYAKIGNNSENSKIIPQKKKKNSPDDIDDVGNQKKNEQPTTKHKNGGKRKQSKNTNTNAGVSKTLRNRSRSFKKNFMQHNLIKTLDNEHLLTPDPVLSKSETRRTRSVFLAKQHRKNLQQGKTRNYEKIKGSHKTTDLHNKNQKIKSDTKSPKEKDKSIKLDSSSDNAHTGKGKVLNPSHVNENKNKTRLVGNHHTDDIIPRKDVNQLIHKPFIDKKIEKPRVKRIGRKLPLRKHLNSLDGQTCETSFLSKNQTIDDPLPENDLNKSSYSSPTYKNRTNHIIQAQLVPHAPNPPDQILLHEKLYAMEQIERERKFLEAYLNAKKATNENFIEIQPKPFGHEDDYQNQDLMNKQLQRKYQSRGNYKCGICGAMKKDHACNTDLFVFDKAVQTEKNITLTDDDKIIIVREKNDD